MATFGLIEYQDASPGVRTVYDDIMATRQTDWINNFWKAIAHDPILLKRTWESIKQIMGPGALDPLTKELIYIAVSVTNNCNYCIASHTASAFGKGMTDAMFKELQAIIGMANETNKLVTGYQVEVDQRFHPLFRDNLSNFSLSCRSSLFEQICSRALFQCSLQILRPRSGRYIGNGTRSASFSNRRARRLLLRRTFACPPGQVFPL